MFAGAVFCLTFVLGGSIAHAYQTTSIIQGHNEDNNRNTTVRMIKGGALLETEEEFPETTTTVSEIKTKDAEDCESPVIRLKRNIKGTLWKFFESCSDLCQSGGVCSRVRYQNVYSQRLTEYCSRICKPGDVCRMFRHQTNITDEHLQYCFYFCDNHGICKTIHRDSGYNAINIQGPQINCVKMCSAGGVCGTIRDEDEYGNAKKPPVRFN